jgi:hypothetical protein
MKPIIVDVQDEHLANLTKFQKPAIPIEELVKNALDADANNVRIDFETNQLGGVVAMRVRDDGTGIDYAHHVAAFKNYGGSLKLGRSRTGRGRRMLGKAGKGRFRALGLGSEVSWISRYRDLDGLKEFSIVGFKARPKQFESTVPCACEAGGTGTEVVVKDVDRRYGETLRSDKTRGELTRRLAAYLYTYKEVKVLFDQLRLTPEALVAHREEYPFQLKLKNGQKVSGRLVIIEWREDLDRMLHLCDEDGAVLHEMAPSIPAKQFSFAAYAMSPWFSEMEEAGRLGLPEIDPDAKVLLDEVRSLMKAHFRRRESERASNLVTKWKRENVYPYKKEEASPVEKVEREVFDICALQIHEHLDGFDSWNVKNKQLTFRLIKEALKSSPGSLQTILSEVLRLPTEEQNTLAKLLEQTQLSAIINATKIVVDRLSFLQGLDDLLFGQYKSDLRERDQFHKILAEELWVFGDQYGLGVNDKGLTKLLQAHLKMLGKQDFMTVEPVTDHAGHKRIVDLMLYRKFPSSSENEFENLVIELKNPRVVLGFDELTQIRNYANKVASDERFDKEKTRWTFLLLGNDIGGDIADECSQDNRLPGQVTSTRGGRFNIFVKRWSTVLSEAHWRYSFYQRQLNLEIKDTDGLDYLHEKHAKLLPAQGTNGHVSDDKDQQAEAED